MQKKAINSINKFGILLVFPINNKPDPQSLWKVLYPKIRLKWGWDEEGDPEVFKMWDLMKRLSEQDDVVYVRWYQNRPTFFSREIFVAMLAYLRDSSEVGRQSKEVLESLEMDSPLSTKQIKEIHGLQGRDMESTYNRTMRELWQRLLIVAHGEFDDSSFPSLAIGATKNIFEDLWMKSQKLAPSKAEKILIEKLGADNLYFKFAQKLRKQLASAKPKVSKTRAPSREVIARV
jgi:hypothetical protein